MYLRSRKTSSIGYSSEEVLHRLNNTVLSSTDTSSELSFRESRSSDASPLVVPSASVVCSDEDDVESEGAGPSSKFKLAAKDLQRDLFRIIGLVGYAILVNLRNRLKFVVLET